MSIADIALITAEIEDLEREYQSLSARMLEIRARVVELFKQIALPNSEMLTPNRPRTLPDRISIGVGRLIVLSLKKRWDLQRTTDHAIERASLIARKNGVGTLPPEIAERIRALVAKKFGERMGMNGAVGSRSAHLATEGGIL